MLANVTEALWIDFDLNTAVFLDTIAYWIKRNAHNKQPRNFCEGRYWTYNTLDALQLMFPGWSKDTIRGIIRKSVKHGLLIVGNFNQKKYDRTCWYSLSDKAIEYYPKLANILYQNADNPGGVSCGDFATPYGETPTPIPILQLAIKDINTTTSESSSNSSNSSSSNSESFIQPNPVESTQKKPKLSGKGNLDLRELIEIYREVFPDNPHPHPKLIATSLERTLQTLIKRWPEAANGNQMTANSFRQYLLDLKVMAPKFSLGEYVTPSGARKKNGLETFCRWNTFVKHLEGAYS